MSPKLPLGKVLPGGVSLDGVSLGGVSLPNVPLPTGGGFQLWTDRRVRGGFRLQRHAITGHHRLIDPDDFRQAWGTFEHCRSKLDSIRPWSDDEDDGRVRYVLIHGLLRTRRCMNHLLRRVRSHGFDAETFGYGSTRASIADHATAMGEVVADWPASWRLRFIAHSMGNIVTRAWIGMGPGDDVLGRCESMVMLGPPNAGSSIARRLHVTGVFPVVAGVGGTQLGRDFPAVRDALATPPFPFAVIAGDVSHFPVANPILDGPNDTLVTVEETKLEGMAEHVVVPIAHAFLMVEEKTCEMAVKLSRELASGGAKAER